MIRTLIALLLLALPAAAKSPSTTLHGYAADTLLGSDGGDWYLTDLTGPFSDNIIADWISSADLAKFKRPRRVVFVKDIPKTASGKILRRLLRDGQYSEITS